MSETIFEPPECKVTETILKFQVWKVSNDGSTEVTKSGTQEDCWDWMVGEFLSEAANKAERTWRYHLVERRKFITEEALSAL